MPDAAASVATRRRPPAWQRWLFVLCLAGGWVGAAAEPATPQPIIRLDKALTAVGTAPNFPAGAPTASVTLPDDWAKTNPHHDGIVWYRVAEYPQVEGVATGVQQRRRQGDQLRSGAGAGDRLDHPAAAVDQIAVEQHLQVGAGALDIER